MWIDVVGSAKELARVGIQAIHGMEVYDFSGAVWKTCGAVDDVPVSDLQEIPERLMSMVLHTLEARLWSAAWDSRTMPSMIAALLAPGSAPREEHINYMEDLWKASVLVESQQCTGSGPQEIRAQIYWLDWPVVQWLMRLLVHFHFQRHPKLESIVRSLCTRMGDTKMVEEMFKHIRGAEVKHQDPKVLDVMALYQKTITHPKPLAQRGIPTVTVSCDQWYTGGSPSKALNFSRITAKNSELHCPRCVGEC